METSASLLVMTRLALTPNGPKELVAVLQRRGEFNHETLGPESWPGACQLTVHGKIEPGETDKVALWRETQEELGAKFAGTTKDDWEFVITTNMQEIGRVAEPNKTIVHYAIEFQPERLSLIRLNASTGGLRLISQSDLANICYLTKFEKQTGIQTRSLITMFPDEIEALERAFEIFGKKRPGIEPEIDGDEVHLRKFTQQQAGAP